MAWSNRFGKKKTCFSRRLFGFICVTGGLFQKVMFLLQGRVGGSLACSTCEGEGSGPSTHQHSHQMNELVSSIQMGITENTIVIHPYRSDGRNKHFFHEFMAISCI